MPIDRCVCTDFTFEEIRQIAKDSGLPLERVMARTGASGSCGCCKPYVACAIETGCCVFEHPLPDDKSQGARWVRAEIVIGKKEMAS